MNLTCGHTFPSGSFSRYYTPPHDASCKCVASDGEARIDHDRYHPFVLFMKTRRQHDQIPLMTLQKSHQEAMIHSSWVIRHVIEAEGANISLYDPFISYLVALAASIQLEHTISENPKVANAAHRKYDKARAYLQRMAKIWPNVGNIVSHSNSTITTMLTVVAERPRQNLGQYPPSQDYQPRGRGVRWGNSIQRALRHERGTERHQSYGKAFRLCSTLHWAGKDLSSSGYYGLNTATPPRGLQYPSELLPAKRHTSVQ